MKNIKQLKNMIEDIDFWEIESSMHDVSQAIVEDDDEYSSTSEGYTAG